MDREGGGGERGGDRSYAKEGKKWNGINISIWATANLPLS